MLQLLSILNQEKCLVPYLNVFSSVLVSFTWWKREATEESVIGMSRGGEEEGDFPRPFLGL